MQYEYLANIAGIEYGMSQLSSIQLRQPLFASFGIGNACSAQLNISYYSDIMPDGLEPIRIYYREKGSTSAWNLKGTYLIAEISVRSDLISLVAFDFMMQTEQPYLEDGEMDFGNWPRPMREVAEDIANRIGVTLDARTTIPAAYQQEYPLDYTMRELLCHIAAACGGNWIITAANKLLLVPLLTSMPPETSLLITETGDAISLGGVRILV